MWRKILAALAALPLLAVPDLAQATPGANDGNGAGDHEPAVVVTEVALQAAPNCPSSWFCFYDNINYAGLRGKLSAKGWQDLSQYGWSDRLESVHNNTSTAVWFLNHTSGGHENDVYLFCVPAYSALADVYPYRNMVDHVHRLSTAWC